MSTDIVYIRDLRVATYIGIYDWEQQVRQELSIDLEMRADIAATAKADSIDATPDYAAISAWLIEYLGNGQFGLLETLAEDLAEQLLERYTLTGLRLRLGKPGAVAEAAEVGVIIERGAPVARGLTP